MKKSLLVLILSSSISFSAELIDAGFEVPDIGTTYQIVNADVVPGWETSAGDNMMEIWHTGYTSVPAYRRHSICRNKCKRTSFPLSGY